MKKIFLVGMPGSGKTTLGKRLAFELGTNFLDLDQEIEKQARRTIPQIFEQSGEAYFRELESRELRRVINQEQNFVLATGGGAPCFNDNMTLLLDSGLTIYLQVDIPTLVERVKNNANRPLLSESENLSLKLGALLKDREPIYRRAHYSITSPDVSQLMTLVKRANHQ